MWTWWGGSEDKAVLHPNAMRVHPGAGLTMTLGGKKPSVSQAMASRPFSVSQSRSSQASSRVQCELCRSLPRRQEESPRQRHTTHKAQPCVLEGLWVAEKVIVTGKLQGWATDTSGKQPHRGRVETCEVGTQHKRHLWLNVP